MGRPSCHSLWRHSNDGRFCRSGCRLLLRCLTSTSHEGRLFTYGKEVPLDIQITPYALDRIPVSLIVDDATVLINLNYFWMRDRNLVDGQNRRWEDVPVVHPESFTREWATWCREEGIKGKFSIVPYPAALGRVDQGLPLFSRAQQDSWLTMCRELIMPSFDITPEMLTHTVIVDPTTLRPVAPPIWEQFDWAALPEDQEELVVDYIETACRILDNVGLTPNGVTSPGGFGGQTLDLYARATGEALRRVTGDLAPFFFQRLLVDGSTHPVVWHPEQSAGTAVGEVIAGAGDWTGDWTGYGLVEPDRYITSDLEGGRVPALLHAGQPIVLCSHWQGFYGMHTEDRRGFRALKTVVERLRALDPGGERTRWRTCSEIARYACARELSMVRVEDNTIALDLPLRVPEITLRVQDMAPRGITVNGLPLRRVQNKPAFESGTWLVCGHETLLAFDPDRRKTTIEINPAET